MKKFLLMLTCLLLLCSGCKQQTPNSGYEDIFFNTDTVHEINFSISNDEWEDMLENASKEEWKKVDVTIDGTTIRNVGLRTKGQSSLEIASQVEGNRRFSLKIKFDKYVDGQTYYGLDEIALNSSFQDATFLKEYLAYDAFRYMDVVSCLTNFSFVTVNGEDYGLFVGIESVDDSYLNRNFADKDGILYKPFVYITYNEDGSENEFFYPDFKYREDMKSYHYNAIFDNAKMDITDKDKERMITSIKNITDGNWEGYYNLENNLAYFAVNNFLFQTDSYPTHHSNNFYVYESDGEITMIPWDYNSVFCVINSYNPKFNGSSIINWSIFSGLTSETDNKSVPLWYTCINEENIDKYVDTYNHLINDYMLSGICIEKMQKAHELIAPYIERDPTKYFSTENCTRGYEAFIKAIEGRAESVRRQIEAYKNNTDFEPVKVDANISAIGWKRFYEDTSVVSD